MHEASEARDAHRWGRRCRWWPRCHAAMCWVVGSSRGGGEWSPRAMRAEEGVFRRTLPHEMVFLIAHEEVTISGHFPTRWYS